MGRAILTYEDSESPDQGLRCPQTETLDAHVQDDVNPYILHMLERTFSLDAARIMNREVSKQNARRQGLFGIIDRF